VKRGKRKKRRFEGKEREKKRMIVLKNEPAESYSGKKSEKENTKGGKVGKGERRTVPT